MDKKIKKTPYILKNYRLANIGLTIFSFALILSAVLLNDDASLVKGKIIPIIITAVVLVTISVSFEFIMRHNYKYSWVRSLDKQRKRRSLDEPESYNLYPIDPRLIEQGLTKEQYEIVKIVRFFLFNIFVGSSIISSMIIIDFDGDIATSVVLPIIMITGVIGIIFVIIDFIVEWFIKRFYKEKNAEDSIDDFEDDNKKGLSLLKKLRILYIPICIIIGIIIVVALIDFKKSISYLIILIAIVLAAEVLAIVIIELIIRKIYKIFNDINNVIDETKEKENDNNEV